MEFWAFLKWRKCWIIGGKWVNYYVSFFLRRSRLQICHEICHLESTLGASANLGFSSRKSVESPACCLHNVHCCKPKECALLNLFSTSTGEFKHSRSYDMWLVSETSALCLRVLVTVIKQAELVQHLKNHCFNHSYVLDVRPNFCLLTKPGRYLYNIISLSNLLCKLTLLT